MKIAYRPVTNYSSTIDGTKYDQDGYKFVLSHLGAVRFITCYRSDGSYSHDVARAGDNVLAIWKKI